jgi:nucleotide-binding universal stress UspA family protein
MPLPPSSVSPSLFRRVLFASNFSSASAAALPYAAAFARRFGSELLTLHVLSPDEETRLDSASVQVALERLRREAEDRVHSLLEAAHSGGLTCRVLIERGEVASVLPAVVERERVELVVTGSEGRHGIQKLLSPPVDEEIAETARCPVLLVGPLAAPPAGRELLLSRILLATDFNPRSTPAIQLAYALAGACSAQLLFLHIADDVWKEPLSTRMTAEAFCRMRMLENGLPEHSPALEPVFLVEFGPPQRMILDSADRTGAGLILMGVPAPAHPVLAAHFPGPLAYDIASYARCPVLVLRNAREPATPADSR